MSFRPSLDYPLTRRFPWRWFAPVVYSAAIVVLVILVVLNTALTGYEMQTVFENDFNITQKHWFHRFAPARAPKPGTLCDPRVFNVGDTFVTNYTTFQWTIEAIGRSNAADTGIVYGGITLDGCDVTSVYLNGDMRTWTIDVTVIATCRVEGEFEATARTAFSLTNLPGRYSPFQGQVQMYDANVTTPALERARAIDAIMRFASQDVGDRIASIIQLVNISSPVALSLQTSFDWCPPSLGPSAPCGAQVPVFNITNAAALFSDTSIMIINSSLPVTDETTPIVGNDTFHPLSNLIQSVHAAVRIDLGNRRPNNYLLNSDVVDSALFKDFVPSMPGLNSTASTSYLIRTKFEELGVPDLFPVKMPGPAQIQVVYVCRFQKKKDPSQAFISILVATLTMFGTIWAVSMKVAAFVVRQTTGPTANRCEVHAPEDAGYGRSEGNKEFDAASLYKSVPSNIR